MYGPRQGVYTFHQFPIRPHSQQLWQWSQLHHSLRWKQSQFKNPDESYKYRSRTEPQNTPQSTSQPATVSSSRSRPASATHVRPTIKSGPQRSTSTVSLPSSRSSSMQTTRSGGRGSLAPQAGIQTRGRGQQQRRLSTQNRQSSTDARRKTWTPAMSSSSSAPLFSLRAQAVNIQPRPLHQRSSSPSQDEESTAPFPYPDPLAVSGDPSFEDRLAELAKLECDTIRHEEAIRRYSAPLLTRPSTAKNIRQPAPKVKVQSVQRVGKSSGSSKEPRSQSGVVRGYRVSLPAASVRSTSKAPTRSTRPNSSTVSVGKPERNSDIPQSKVIATSKVKDTAVNAPVNEKQGETEVPLLVTKDEPQPVASGDEIDTVSELSCSPPIVYITSLPNYKPKPDKQTTKKDGSVQDLRSPAKHPHPPSPVIHAWSDDGTTTEPECNTATQTMEDDLQATSDLGLSIDSLHMIDDDNMVKDVESQAGQEMLTINETQDSSSCCVKETVTVDLALMDNPGNLTPATEPQSEVPPHVTRKGSAGKRTTSASSNSRNIKNLKRHAKNCSKRKSSQSK